MGAQKFYTIKKLGYKISIVSVTCLYKLWLRLISSYDIYKVSEIMQKIIAMDKLIQIFSVR